MDCVPSGVAIAAILNRTAFPNNSRLPMLCQDRSERVSLMTCSEEPQVVT